MMIGTLLLYCGIAGMAVTALIVPIVLLVLRLGKKKLKNALDAEYEMPDAEKTAQYDPF